jgi:hypothetical protein
MGYVIQDRRYKYGQANKKRIFENSRFCHGFGGDAIDIAGLFRYGQDDGGAKKAA